MFKFSFNFVKEICGFDIKEEELFEILNLQGFEVDEKIRKGDDTVVTIEVKANRPDMLSHIGIAREICAFKGKKLPEPPIIDLKSSFGSFPFNLEIDSDAAKRFSLVVVDGIDNNVPTPEHIKIVLEKLGINPVNAVVDIANYVMLKYGQPMHTYDVNKISGNDIKIQKSEKEYNILTLGNVPAKIQKGYITVSDEKDILCVAGIIGTDKVAVNKDTTCVMVEAACFDEVSIRLASRKMKISTPSSFRFERGIDITQCFNMAGICAKMIAEICGGKIRETIFDYYPIPKNKTFIDLRVSRTNLLLGTSVTKEKIVTYLEKYEFKCKNKSNDIINVEIPSYRLDVTKEVDLIEEVARIHGYDNISPVMPTMKLQYKHNVIWENIDKLREIFVGLGFYEVITYSFIPKSFTEMFNINKNDDLYSDLVLKNPINKDYALMRPTLVYSLVSSLAYNYSMNNTDLSIFEIGRTYFKNQDEENASKTGYKEIDKCGFVFSGKRVEKGWGINNDIKYSYYDLLNYLSIIFQNFGQEFELKGNNYKFCEESSGYDIISNGQKVGFLGELNKKVINKISNAKLIKDPVFYCEISIKDLKEKNKKLKFESKYPSLVRTYNFMLTKDISSEKVEKIISESSPLIQDIEVKDIYVDKNMKDNQYSLLYEIKYCSSEFTLTSEQIEKIEASFINVLSSQLNVNLKM